MRYSEIVEAKIPANIAISNFLKTQTNLDEWFVRMTTIPKFGINPGYENSGSDTLGIYAYPAEFYLRWQKKNQALPIGNDFQYIWAFQVPTNLITQKEQFNSDASVKQKLIAYRDELIKRFKIDSDKFERLMLKFPGTNIGLVEMIISLIQEKDVQTDFHKQLHRESILKNWMYRKLGLVAMQGFGNMIPNELVVLDPRIVKNTKLFSHTEKSQKAMEPSQTSREFGVDYRYL